MGIVVIELLAAVCMAVHLWCVNVSSAAPLLGIVMSRLSRKYSNAPLRDYARTLGVQGILMLIAGTAAGLALAGVMWLAHDRGLFDVLPLFSYKIFWAIWELIFYLVCMSAYVGLASDRLCHRRWARVLQTVFAILASTNLLYHFPPLFAVMAQAAAQPDRISSPVGPREFRELLVQGHVLALTAHFALASFAVTTVVAMFRLVRMRVAEDQAGAVARAVRICAVVALTATALQLLVGMLVLLNLGPVAQSRLMGGDPWGTLTLAISVLGTFLLLHRLASGCVSTPSEREARTTLIWLLLIVLLMTVTLRRAEKRTRAVAALDVSVSVDATIPFYRSDGLSSAN